VKNIQSKSIAWCGLLATAVAGVFYSHYLTGLVLQGSGAIAAVCSGNSFFDCGKTLGSSYGKVFGIPVSFFATLYFGWMIYHLLSNSLWSGGSNGQLSAKDCRRLFGLPYRISLLAAGVCLVLAGISFFVLHAVCLYCLMLDGLVVLTLGLSYCGIRISHKNAQEPQKGKARSFLVNLVPLRGLDFVSQTYQRARRDLMVYGLHWYQRNWRRHSALIMLILFSAEMIVPSHLLWAMRSESSLQSVTVAEANTSPLGKNRLHIVKFTDFECPACQYGAVQLEKLKEKYPGQVEIEVVNFPLSNKYNPSISSDLHPLAGLAAKGGIVMKQKGKFDEYYKRIMDRNENLTEKKIDEVIKQLNEDVVTIRKQTESSEVAQILAGDIERGKALDIHSTPTLIVNGVKLADGVDIAKLESMIFGTDAIQTVVDNAMKSIRAVSLLPSSKSVMTLASAGSGPIIMAAGASINAASCSRIDVGNAIAAAVNGDTVVIPAGSCTWDTQLQFTKAITLQGAGCTLDSNGYPTSCQTVIKDGINVSPFPPLITWTLVAGYAHRLTGIGFQNDTRASRNGNPLISIVGTNRANTTFRFDHNRVHHTAIDRLMWITAATGVVDHNWFENTINAIFFIGGNNWYGPNGEAPPNPDYGDSSLYHPVTWGGPSFIFFENNRLIGPNRACTDSGGGGRWVFRFNTVTGCTGGSHGTDSGGRSREVRASEFYKNSFDQTGFTRNWIFENRDGSSILWGNTAINFPVFQQTAARLNNYRSGSFYQPFGGADGRNPVDVNDPNNPYDPGSACPSKVCTATSGNSLTATVSGANWNASNGGQWKGYVLLKLNCSASATVSCHSIILSNTANTISVAGNQGAGGTFANFQVGDTFEINKVLETIDQPGRGGGSLLQGKQCTSINGDGVNVTATCTGINASVGDYVAIFANSPHQEYGGVRKVLTAPNANTVTYAFTASSGNTTGGTATKIPASWNDQVDFPSLQWLNSNTSGGVTYNLKNIPFLHSSNIRENEHYFNYDPALVFDGTIASNRSSIGAGPIVNRPASCTAGVLYWATDEGEWNSTNGSTSDGRLYKCTATDTWSLFYTPYTYPHPLTQEAGLILTVKKDGTGNFTTIQACANAVQSGGTCLVYPGNYPEHIATARGSVTFKASGLVTIEGFRIQHPYIVIDGFDITGYTGPNLAYIRVESAGDSCTIKNNVFRDGIYLSSEAFSFNAVDKTITNAAGGFIAAGFKIGASIYLASFHDPYNRPLNHDNNKNDGDSSTFTYEVRRIAAITDTTLTLDANSSIWTESGVVGTIYVNTAEKGGVNAINFVNSSANGTPDGCSILNNTFKNLAGRVLHLEGHNTTISYNTFTQLNGWRLLSMFGNNSVFTYNTYMDSPRWPNFTLPPFGWVPSQGGGTWDMYDAIFESQMGATSMPANNNVIAYNFIKDVDTQFSNITAYTPVGAAVGLNFHHNVFVNFEMAGSVTRPGTEFRNNTFYKTARGSAHTMNLGYSTIGPSDPNPTTLMSNAFAGSGDMTCASRNGSTCVGTPTTEQKAARGWYNLDDGRTSGYQFTPGITANYNFVAGTAADGWPAKNAALFVADGQEANGINGGDPKFQDANNPLGPDGIPFTLDDGLKPLTTSPLCGKGEGGTDIGAYNCDPSTVFASSPDSDGDGLLDAWEIQHFGSMSDPRAQSGLDPDGDGFSNLAEQTAGTSPIDSKSALRITSVSLSENIGLTITWQSISNKTYTVQSASNIGSWTNTASVSSISSSTSWIDSSPSASKKFYRVKLP
jgi:protein-disulfide isomerase/uncharacterized membrane protein